MNALPAARAPHLLTIATAIALAACNGGAAPKAAAPASGAAEADQAQRSAPPAAAGLAACLDLATPDELVALPRCLAGLHARPRCAAAWRDAAVPFTPAAVAGIATACASEYCPDLAEPRPRGCAAARAATGDFPPPLLDFVELEAALLAHDRDLAGAPHLSARLGAALFASTTALGGVEVELPRAAAPAAPESPARVVSLTSDGTILLGDRVVDADALGAQLAELVAADPELRVLIRADRDIPYQRVIEVMDRIKAAGVSQLALATE